MLPFLALHCHLLHQQFSGSSVCADLNVDAMGAAADNNGDSEVAVDGAPMVATMLVL